MPIDPSTAFVSYSREDLEFVLRLAKDLKAKGAKVWMDKLDIRPGQRWENEVQTALDGCQRMLVILSPTSVASSNVLAEAAFAIDEGKEVIPVLYRECKIPFRLRPFQYADFRSDYSVALEDLLASLSSQHEVAVKELASAAVPVSSTVRSENRRKLEDRWELTELQGRADVGDTAAMVDLADAYLAGIRVPKDVSRAVTWYQKAADAGDATAMGKLALRYMFGEGVVKDEVQAASWYRRAADLGDDFAMFNLAKMYEVGQGVERDYEQARRWYQKTAQYRPDDVDSALDRIKMKEAVERARRAEEEQTRQERAEAQRLAAVAEATSKHQEQAEAERKQRERAEAQRLAAVAEAATRKRQQQSEAERMAWLAAEERQAREKQAPDGELGRQRLAAEQARLEAERTQAEAEKARLEQVKFKGPAGKTHKTADRTAEWLGWLIVVIYALVVLAVTWWVNSTGHDTIAGILFSVLILPAIIQSWILRH